MAGLRIEGHDHSTVVDVLADDVVEVRVADGLLDVTVGPVPVGPDDVDRLVALLADLAADWRGWDGRRSWELWGAGYGDRIVALHFGHDGTGTVSVLLEAGSPLGDGPVAAAGWRIDAGQLQDVAGRVLATRG